MLGNSSIVVEKPDPDTALGPGGNPRDDPLVGPSHLPAHPPPDALEEVEGVTDGSSGYNQVEVLLLLVPCRHCLEMFL